MGIRNLPNSHHELETETETAPLLSDNTQLSLEDANKYFTTALDEETTKILDFYTKKEAELLMKIRAVFDEIRNVEKTEETHLMSVQQDLVQPDVSRSKGPTSANSPAIPQIASSSSNELAIDLNALSYHTMNSSFFATLMWSSEGFKKQKGAYAKNIVELYVATYELQEYVDINQTGFSKVLKKYEKVVGAKLKSKYLARIETTYPFLVSTKGALQHALDQLVILYARINTEGKLSEASSDLKSHLQEHIVWERNTIWREMVEKERKQTNIGFSNSADNAVKFFTIQVFGFPVKIPSVFPNSIIVIICAIIALVVIAQSRILETEPQTNCLAILVAASILWAFEALPLFVTSITVPFFVVIMRVMLGDSGDRLPPPMAAKVVFSHMFNPTIMLLLGGFSLAGALSKHNVAKEMAAMIIRRSGSDPKWVLLTNMLVSTFFSMWISNVAAPVLCFSLVSPILRNLPQKSPYGISLVLGIAMAANVGGMASPIASPQNIIAVGHMKPAPSWVEWFIIALPVCIILDLLIWGLLIVIYNPSNSGQQTAPPEIFSNEHISKHKFNGTQVFILFVSVFTILMWCIESVLKDVVGDMGVIAIIPIVCFYGTGVLTKDDWNSMLWSVVMLAMGGISLGEAVKSSGLLGTITGTIRPYLMDMSLFTCTVILCGILAVVTSFISHTVGALILLPIIADIGHSLPSNEPRTLVMCAALMCSGGMALPVSSFPNMNAISLEDSKGMNWLTVKDFLKIGVLGSLLAWLTISLVAYAVAVIIKFG